MKIIAFEGIDNVGKTSVSRGVAENLRADGFTVHQSSPFHETTLSGEELFSLFNGNEQDVLKANTELLSAVSSAEQQALDEKADYLLFDRHWMTVFTMTDNKDWLNKWLKPKTALLVPGKRPLQDMTDEEPWSSVEELEKYKSKYEKLAKTYKDSLFGIYVVEVPERDISAVVLTILWDERIMR